MFSDWYGEFVVDDFIDGVLEKGVKDIKVIVVLVGMFDLGVGKFIEVKRVKSFIIIYIVFNFCVKEQMFVGELDVEFSF